MHEIQSFVVFPSFCPRSDPLSRHRDPISRIHPRFHGHFGWNLSGFHSFGGSCRPETPSTVEGNDLRRHHHPTGIHLRHHRQPPFETCRLGLLRSPLKPCRTDLPLIQLFLVSAFPSRFIFLSLDAEASRKALPHFLPLISTATPRLNFYKTSFLTIYYIYEEKHTYKKRKDKGQTPLSFLYKAVR